MVSKCEPFLVASYLNANPKKDTSKQAESEQISQVSEQKKAKHVFRRKVEML
jgi:hypothetical protein